jgi:protoheme ferro-lyase
VEYDELFQEHGGEEVTLVPSLNVEDFWVDAVVTIVNS